MQHDGHPVSRAELFGHPDPSEVALSPDGIHLAWLAHHDGVWRAFVAPWRNPVRPRMLTRAEGVSRALFWGGDRHLIVFRDFGGDENYRAFAIEIGSGAEHALTPPGCRALFCRTHATVPNRVLFQVNDRNPAQYDLMTVDVATGASTRLEMGQAGYSRIHADGALVPKLMERVRRDGGLVLLRPDAKKWVPVRVIAMDDVLTSRVVSVSDGSAFLIDSPGRDKAALIELDLATGAETLLATDADADIADVLISPSDGRPLAASSCLHIRRWQAIGSGFAPVLDRLAARAGGGQLGLLDFNGGCVLARVEHDDRRPEYVVHDTARDASTDVPLPPRPPSNRRAFHMHPVDFPSRDGHVLRSYLTRPADGPGPMVVLVHGGPYDRDSWGYSPIHQWLAGRGYAVLAVNFRGSVGFGKEFVRAADHEWGNRMLDDLQDGIDWAIGRGIADPRRVFIMGHSYGGYAALMSAALRPDRFVGVVSIAGPTDLVAFVEAIPAYWRSWFAMIRERLANPDRPEGRAWLRRNSPLSHCRNLKMPVLLMHGANDVRVAPSHPRRMADALAKGPVTLAVFPDEGHFIARTANTVAMAGLIETFLASITNMPVEDPRDDLAASSLKVEHGGAFLPPEILARLRV